MIAARSPMLRRRPSRRHRPSRSRKARRKKGIVEKGKLAASIPITTDRSSGGVVVPGSKVDIVHTDKGERRTILENVLVLSLEMPEILPEDRPRIYDAWLTVQLDDPGQVLKLVQARKTGTLGVK